MTVNRSGDRESIVYPIKINGVIIPTHEQRALGPVTETRKCSARNRGYIDLTAKIT